MNFLTLLRLFDAGKFCCRAIYPTPLVRRLSFSSTELKRWSFQDQVDRSYTTLQFLKAKHHYPERRISFQRKYCSLNISDSQDGGLKTEEPNVVTEQEHPNRRTIFVGSLNYMTDEEKLRTHFLVYGDIEHIRVLRNTTSLIPKNFAFVIFKCRESVEKAVHGKNFIDSRWLQVERHDRDVTQERKIHISGISTEIEVKDIQEYFSQYGDIKAIDIPWNGGNRRDYAFLEFLTGNSVIKALQKPSHEVKGHALRVSACISKRRRTTPGKVVVDVLPVDISLEDVKKYFEQFGRIISIDMVYKRDLKASKTFAFLCFQSQEVAEEVSNSQRNHYINDQQVIVRAMHSKTRLRPGVSREKKVFVEGIPLGKMEDEILDYFSQFGEAVHVHLIDSWAERQVSQCGIIRFKSKSDVDNLLSRSEILMEGSPLKVLRLGFTAETSSEYTPFYSEFRRKHQINSTDAYIQENEEIMQRVSLNRYPNID